jgi:hypothetical protein
MFIRILYNKYVHVASNDRCRYIYNPSHKSQFIAVTAR